LFLVVKFSQLSEYKLSNATIELSFDTIHLEKDLEISEGRRIVTVTNHLAPMFLCGPESERKVNSSMKFMPELGIGNIANIAGVGIDTAQEMVKKAWWIFSGDRVQNNKLGGRYTDVRWLWESNPLNKQIENLNRLHVAFVVKHRNEPIATAVTIEGKLRKGWALGKVQSAPVLRRILPNPKNILDPADIKSFDTLMKEKNMPQT